MTTPGKTSLTLDLLPASRCKPPMRAIRNWGNLSRAGRERLQNEPSLQRQKISATSFLQLAQPPSVDLVQVIHAEPKSPERSFQLPYC